MKKQLILTGLTAMMFAACNNSPKPIENTTEETTGTPAASNPAVREDTAWRKNAEGVYAKIFTPKGVIVCQLEYEKTPITVASFTGLSEGMLNNMAKPLGKPYFDGLTFHRVEPGFVIQGGDPAGNGSGGPGYEFINEINPELKHNAKGILAMANAGPNTNGSQFYLTFNATPPLDGSYTVFGHTVSGMEVIDQIAVGDMIDSIRIARIGDKAKAYEPVKIFEANRKFITVKKTPEQLAWDAKVKAKFPKAKETGSGSGLYYIIEKEGKGAQAVAGKGVAVNYTGTLWDGKVFDSSVGKSPYQFRLGTGTVIPGWDEGIALMKVGTKMKLIIPSHMAYGANPRPDGPIPPNADLIFDTELMSVE